MSNESTERPANKSLAAALLLTFFLGPFGLCYVNVILGVILGIIWLLCWIFTFGLLAFIPWVVGMVFAAIDIENYNNGRPLMFETEKFDNSTGN